MDPKEGIIRFPKDHTEIFETLLAWMNFRKTRIDLGKELWKAGMDLAGHVFGWGALAMLWTMADKYQITGMEDDLIDAAFNLLRDLSHNARNPDQVLELVHENVPESSPIHRLLAFLSRNCSDPPPEDCLDLKNMDSATLTLFENFMVRSDGKLRASLVLTDYCRLCRVFDALCHIHYSCREWVRRERRNL
jgi:hypothetical protein